MGSYRIDNACKRLLWIVLNTEPNREYYHCLRCTIMLKKKKKQKIWKFSYFMCSRMIQSEWCSLWRVHYNYCIIAFSCSSLFISIRFVIWHRNWFFNMILWFFVVFLMNDLTLTRWNTFFIKMPLSTFQKIIFKLIQFFSRLHKITE